MHCLSLFPSLSPTHPHTLSSTYFKYTLLNDAELFDGDHEKVKALNKMVCEKMGFTKWQQVSGQTYTRKLDYMVLSCLSGLAQSAYKMCGDIRLLASMKEIGKYNNVVQYYNIILYYTMLYYTML